MNTILLWDSEKPLPKSQYIPVLWRTYGESEDVSIPKIVEDNANEFREKILTWIYQLGEMKVRDKRIVDHLELRPGFSYWWMTLLAGKRTHMKTPRFYDAARLFALAKFVQEKKVEQIVLVSDDVTLANMVRGYCHKSGISFKTKRRFFCRTLKNLLEPITFPFLALLLLLKHIVKKWRLRDVRLKDKQFADLGITIFNYLALFGLSSSSLNSFTSSYWSNLLDNEHGVNWLHWYIPCPEFSSARKVTRVMRKFNATSKGMHSHQFLGSMLGVPLICSVVVDYLTILRKCLYLRKMRSFAARIDSDIELWPLFRRDWYLSLCGTIGMDNCFSLSVLEKNLERMPRQKLGMYLQENQPWEMALISAWKRFGHGDLIGVPHATIRFWDLRYFSNSQLYISNAANKYPMPDFVAINGDIAYKEHIESGYPAKKLVKTEALRYLYLENYPKIICETGNLCILICGDSLCDVTEQMFSCLEVAAQSINNNVKYIYKPHPNCTLDVERVTSLPIEIRTSSLVELLPYCDMVYASNITSAAVDAYLAGVLLVQMLDGNAFNLSPLRGLKSVKYVSHSSELADEINNFSRRDNTKPVAYFYLDNSLPRWRAVLARYRTGL